MMRVGSPQRLEEAKRRHADAVRALNSWEHVTRGSTWRNLIEVRHTFPSADAVAVKSGNVVTIFNIRGNNYRLITGIDYPCGLVNVLLFLTHAEYDKESWKKKL